MYREEIAMNKRVITALLGTLLLLCLLGCHKVETVKYTVDFIVDGEVYRTINTDGKSISMPNNPVLERCKFDGWFWDEDVWESPFTLNSLFDQPLTENNHYQVYAKWINEQTSVRYQISFYVDGKIYYETVTDGISISMPQDPKKHDFVFNGWYFDENIWQEPFSVESLPDQVTAESCRVYAKWKESPILFLPDCSVSFYVDGQLYDRAETSGTTLLMPVDPKKDNFIFDGWFWDKDVWRKPFTLSSLFDQPMSENPDFKVYAKFQGVECHVEFAVSELYELEPITVRYDTNFRLPVPKVEGYSFQGWYLLTASQEELLTDANGNGLNMWDHPDPVTLYPLLARSVSFDSAGGNDIETRDYVWSKPFGDLPLPHKNGYDFDGWYTETGLPVTETTVFDSENMLILVARWTAKEYLVTFAPQNGDAPTTLTVRSGENYSLPDEPQRTGYLFSGWCSQPDGLGEYIDETNTFVHAQDQTLYAVWTGIEYTITYVGYNDQVVRTRQIAFGTSYQLELVYQIGPDSIKYLFYAVPGYTFHGWYTEPNGGGIRLHLNSVLTEAKDHSVYAYYTLSDSEVLSTPAPAQYVAYNSAHGSIVTYGETESGYELNVYDRSLNKLYTAWSGNDTLFAYDTDGDYIAYADGSSALTILRIKDGSFYRKVDCSPWNLTSVAMDENILIIPYGNENGALKFHDLSDGKEYLGEAPDEYMTNPFITVNKDAHIVYLTANGRSPGQLLYYSTLTGELLYESPHGELYTIYEGVRFDGTYVWYGFDSVFDPLTGEKLPLPDLTPYGNPDEGATVLCAFTEDRVVLITNEEQLFNTLPYPYHYTARVYQIYDRKSKALLKKIYVNYDSQFFACGEIILIFDGQSLALYAFG